MPRLWRGVAREEPRATLHTVRNKKMNVRGILRAKNQISSPNQYQKLLTRPSGTVLCQAQHAAIDRAQ
jgi:hypothetical protein